MTLAQLVIQPLIKVLCGIGAESLTFLSHANIHSSEVCRLSYTFEKDIYHQ